MGEAKRRKAAGTYPSPADQAPRPVALCPERLQRPAANFRPTEGNVAIIIDEPGCDLVVLQMLANDIPVVVQSYHAFFKGNAKEAETLFFGSMHDWLQGKRNPAPPMPDDEAYARGLSAAYWLAFGESPEAPGRGATMQGACSMQLETYGAACLTMGVLLRPHQGPLGKSPRTRRWCIEPTEPPGYINPNTILGRNESMH